MRARRAGAPQRQQQSGTEKAAAPVQQLHAWGLLAASGLAERRGPHHRPACFTHVGQACPSEKAAGHWDGVPSEPDRRQALETHVCQVDVEALQPRAQRLLGCGCGHAQARERHDVRRVQQVHICPEGVVEYAPRVLRARRVGARIGEELQQVHIGAEHHQVEVQVLQQHLPQGKGTSGGGTCRPHTRDGLRRMR